MEAIFHQFYLARLKLYHSIAFSMNPWVCSTHRSLSILFVWFIDDKTHIILGFNLHKNRILRVRVLHHLGGWGMQIVMWRLLLMMKWVLMQKYLLLRFIHMEDKLFRWNAWIRTCYTRNCSFLKCRCKLNLLSCQKLTLIISFVVMQWRPLLNRCKDWLGQLIVHFLKYN